MPSAAAAAASGLSDTLVILAVSISVQSHFVFYFRLSTTPGNLLEFKNPPGNPGNLLEFVLSSWKFLCKMSTIDLIGFQS